MNLLFGGNVSGFFKYEYNFYHIHGWFVGNWWKVPLRFEELGVEFSKKPNDGKMKGLAFIKEKQVSYYILCLQFYLLLLHPSLPKLKGSSFLIFAVLLPLCPSVGWLVFWLVVVVDPYSVGRTVIKGRVVTLACSYRSSCFIFTLFTVEILHITNNRMKPGVYILASQKNSPPPPL